MVVQIHTKVMTKHLCFFFLLYFVSQNAIKY